MSAASAAAGKNGSTENLDRTDDATAVPNNALLPQAGCSSHASIARNAAPNVAVSAMSVVASPPCARAEGRNVKHSVANKAAGSPKQRRVHRYTTSEAS